MPFMSAIDAIRGQEIKVLKFFLFSHCYHLLSLFKVLKWIAKLWALANFTFSSVPFLMTLATFLTYIYR